MKKYLLLFLLLMCLPTVVKSQTHDEIGMFSCGQLATEVTRYVRCPQLPAMVYLARGHDWIIKGDLYLTTKGALSIQTLSIKECNEIPCKPLGRFERYRGPIVAEPLWMTLNPRAGISYKPVDYVSIGSGLALPIVYCPEAYCGAAPMLVYGVWVDGRVNVPLKDGKWGIAVTLTHIPPQHGRTPRWTTLSEWSGYKQYGQNWPNGKYDPKKVNWLEIGLFFEK